MSRVGLIVSLLVAAILTLAAAYLYRPAGAGASTTDGELGVPLIPFDAQQAHTIEVDYPDGRTVTVERAGRTLDWWIVIDPGADAPPRVWAASQASVRTALRLLATLDPVVPADAGSIDRPGATLRLVGDDAAFECDLAPRTVGGKGLLETDLPDAGRTVVSVPADVHDLAMSPGPSIWRETLAVPGLAGAGLGEVSRIELRSGDRAMLLTRIQGRWWLFPGADQTAAGIAADAEAVQRLLSTISQTRVSRFIDEPTSPEITGLADPTATIVLESTRRLPSGERRDRRRVLSIGQGAGLSGESLFATLDDDDARAVGGADAEAQLFAVDGATLATLAMAPEAYISPIALLAGAGDVGEIVLRTDAAPLLEMTRTLDGWRRLVDDQQRVPTPEEERLADQIIALATGTPGDPVLRDDATWAPVGEIELHDLGGAPLATFELGLAPSPEGRPDAVVLVDDRVARVYAPERADAVLDWLTP
jgi:hypothetical protein